MGKPSQPMRDLARQLLAASQTGSDPHVHAAVRLCGTLRILLTRFAGADGAKSLLSRALALASAEVPSLQHVKLAADGRLEGLEQLAAETGCGAREDEEAIAITAHLLDLLVTFIGESLTLSLVQKGWPEMSLNNEHLSRG